MNKKSRKAYSSGNIWKVTPDMGIEKLLINKKLTIRFWWCFVLYFYKKDCSQQFYIVFQLFAYRQTIIFHEISKTVILLYDVGRTSWHVVWFMSSSCWKLKSIEEYLRFFSYTMSIQCSMSSIYFLDFFRFLTTVLFTNIWFVELFRRIFTPKPFRILQYIFFKV